MTDATRHARMRAITRPSLSVLCGIHGNGALAAGCLRPLRELADEIIVAFDARTDPTELGPLEPIADRLIGYPVHGARPLSAMAARAGQRRMAPPARRR